MIPVILFTKAVIWGAGIAASTALPLMAGTGTFYAGATLAKAKVAVNDGLPAVDSENRPIQLLPGEILQLLAHDDTWEGPEICLPGGRSVKDVYPEDTPEVIYARARKRAKKYAYFIRKGIMLEDRE